MRPLIAALFLLVTGFVHVDAAFAEINSFSNLLEAITRLNDLNDLVEGINTGNEQIENTIGKSGKAENSRVLLNMGDVEQRVRYTAQQVRALAELQFDDTPPPVTFEQFKDCNTQGRARQQLEQHLGQLKKNQSDVEDVIARIDRQKKSISTLQTAVQKWAELMVTHIAPVPYAESAAANAFSQSQNVSKALSDLEDDLDRKLRSYNPYARAVAAKVRILEGNLRDWVRAAPCSVSRPASAATTSKPVLSSKDSCLIGCDKWFSPTALPKPNQSCRANCK